jgi:glycosyltransferase involved in cell wall biosynthesis
VPIINRFAQVVMPIGYGVADAHPGVNFSADRTVVFYPPVDTELFRPDTPSTLRAELGIPEDALVVGVVGNLNPQKGHEHFIAAAARARKRFPNARFVLTGQIYLNHPTHTDYYNGLVSQAKASGLEVGKTFFFLGARSDIPNVLAGLDVFALASVPNSEGTPTVILEAMATGLPVVASDVGSVREVVADGETGFVTPSEDSATMADRFATLLADAELRKRMGAAGRVRVEQEFNLDRCVDAHLRAYELAIARGRKKRGSSHG